MPALSPSITIELGQSKKTGIRSLEPLFKPRGNPRFKDGKEMEGVTAEISDRETERLTGWETKITLLQHSQWNPSSIFGLKTKQILHKKKTKRFTEKFFGFANSFPPEVAVVLVFLETFIPFLIPFSFFG